MLTPKSALAITLVLAATTAAFAAAQDPDVRARQEVMGLIGSNIKKIAPMAQQKVDFDAAAAQAAFAVIAEKAAMIPQVFETRSNHDPEAEAKDALWDNWDDFLTKAGNLKAAAEAGKNIDSLEALQAAMGPLGGACKACHTAYKE